MPKVDIAAADIRDGLQNRSSRDVLLLEVGSRRNDDGCDYPDIDLVLDPGSETYRHRDVRPYGSDAK